MALNKAAKKWVAALRSGKYKQHRGMLANEARDRFCCLGVACEIAVKAGVITEYTQDSSGLPKEVMDWLGLATIFGNFYENDNGDDLTVLNDTGKRFTTIAKVIARQPKGMFREVPTVKRSGKPATEKPEKHSGRPADD